jgi:hypothetical protein
MCEDCIHLDKKSDEKPCNTCIQWIEGNKEFTKFESKYFCDNCC